MIIKANKSRCKLPESVGLIHSLCTIHPEEGWHIAITHTAEKWILKLEEEDRQLKRRGVPIHAGIVGDELIVSPSPMVDTEVVVRFYPPMKEM